MITSESELEQARRQAERLETLILEIRRTLPARQQLTDEMVHGYESRLRSIRLDIDSFLGVGDLRQADLILRVASPDIGTDGAPSTILVDTLEKFRKAIASSYSQLARGGLRGAGRPPDELRVASEPRVLWLAPGSLRIGLDLPPSFHQRSVLSWSSDVADRSVKSPIQNSIAFLLAAAWWASSEEPIEKLEETIPDSGTRKVVLEQVRQLSPTPKGRVSSLEIEGDPRIVTHPILLTNSARLRAREGAYPGSTTQEFEDTGILRKVTVDTDRAEHFFELRERPRGRLPVRGDFPEDLRVRVFHAIHGKYRVRVRGILETKVGRQTKQTLHLEDFVGESAE
jgi:hypothetical protein